MKIEQVKTKNSFFGFERDTIFVGNFSREAKIHTVENIVRVIGCCCLIFAGANLDNSPFLLGIVGVILVGIMLRDEKEGMLIKFW